MAKATWCTVNPTEGSGNKTVNVSGETHTGRTARQTTLTITAANVEPVTVQVNQAGKPEYVDSQDTAAVVKDLPAAIAVPAAFAAPAIDPIATFFKAELVAPPIILVATPLELVSPLVNPLIELSNPIEFPNLLIA